ncbi:MAG: glycosyltransferase family 2 protein [Planctomycetota bacterium]|nr:glycosyltransferase family 2 protein [Planctomycetota bacterium]
MPALNEAANIQAAVSSTLAALDSFKIAGEVLVVNDGSTDRTGELVAALSATDSRVRTLRHEKPQGIGASFWDGVMAARGEFVCMLPGDNENEPAETLRYMGLMNDVDIVVPFVCNRQVRSRWRNLLSHLYRAIINTTFMVNFNYTNGTVIYRRSILKELPFHSTGFFYQTDILVRMARQGYLFAEVPYRLGARSKGTSKALSLRSLIRVAGGYLRLFQDIYLSGRGRARGQFVQDSQTARRFAGRSAGVPPPPAASQAESR